MSNDTMNDILKKIEFLPDKDRIDQLYDWIAQESQKPDDQIDMQLIADCTALLDQYSAADPADVSAEEIARIYETHREQIGHQRAARSPRGRHLSPHKRAIVAAAAAFVLLCSATMSSLAAIHGAQTENPGNSYPDLIVYDSEYAYADPYDPYFSGGVATEDVYLTKALAEDTLVFYTLEVDGQTYYQAVANTGGVEFVVESTDYNQLVAYMNELMN